MIVSIGRLWKTPTITCATNTGTSALLGPAASVAESGRAGVDRVGATGDHGRPPSPHAARLRLDDTWKQHVEERGRGRKTGAQREG